MMAISSPPIGATARAWSRTDRRNHDRAVIIPFCCIARAMRGKRASHHRLTQPCRVARAMPEPDPFEVVLERSAVECLGHTVGDDEAGIPGVELHRLLLEGRIPEKSRGRPASAQEVQSAATFHNSRRVTSIGGCDGSLTQIECGDEAGH